MTPAWFRSKLAPEERAAQIKAKYAAKMSENQGLFTGSQSELMAELGLTPDQSRQEFKQGAENSATADLKKARPGKAARARVKRDPLTKRQRELMQELGLASNPDQQES
jgi:hypothetical protein